MQLSSIQLASNLLQVSILKLHNVLDTDFGHNFLIDLDQNLPFLESINSQISTNNIFRVRSFDSIYQFNVYRNFIYYFVRLTRPRLIIETGVFHGLTSAWILQALEDNQSGQLISIDLPRRDWDSYFTDRTFGPGDADRELDELGDLDPGWIIPDYLRNRWELILSPSELALQPLLNKSSDLDLFIHDSDHSYQTMSFEVNLIRNLFPGCPIFIDDFYENSFTYELLSSNPRPHLLVDDVTPQNLVLSSTALLL